jgi:hypothetical protein
MKAINNALIIDSHPAAAAGDYSLAAAPVSKIPTKRYPQHRPSPKIR